VKGAIEPSSTRRAELETPCPIKYEISRVIWRYIYLYISIYIYRYIDISIYIYICILINRVNPTSSTRRAELETP